MSYILPKPLTKHDTIAVIAPSGPITDKDALCRGRDFFEDAGYKVVFSKYCFSQDRYLSASDENRLEDLHWAFSNPDVNAIICARGGYGALRLINDINYDLIKNNPKIFCGYSDITILSAMFLKRANLITYSSPMMKGDFGKEDKDSYTIDQFFKAVKNEQLCVKGSKTIRKGVANGIIWGGNLSSIVSLAGIDFIPDEDFIFFTEDLNEPVYKIDKMFTQLMNMEKFRKNVKGLVFGQFLDVNNSEQLDFLFNQISEKLNIPTSSGYLISHDDTKDTIPYGKNCVLDNNKLII